MVLRQLQEAEFAVGDPQISRSVPGKGTHEPTRSRRRYKTISLQVADPRQCGDPDSPARVLKEGPDPLIR
jgi:hypothetical protein